jgi:hypothetical protein
MEIRFGIQVDVGAIICWRPRPTRGGEHVSRVVESA